MNKQNVNSKRVNIQNKNILLIFISLGFLLALINYIQIKDIAQYNDLNPVGSSITIDQLTIINLTSSHPQNEKIAYLAALQAIDKHLPNATPAQKQATLYDLVAIAHQENRDFNYLSSGADSYTSYGLYQISLHYHPNITPSQALDPYFSADWTLARLINNGYLTGNRDNAIMRHNGTPNTKATTHYLNDINNYITNNL